MPHVNESPTGFYRLAQKSIAWFIIPAIGFLALQVWSLSTRVPAEIPPAWFRDEVSEISDTLKHLSDNIQAVQVQAAVMNADRFTLSDGLEVWREIDQLRAEIKVLKER